VEVVDIGKSIMCVLLLLLLAAAAGDVDEGV